jgi:hypothetical protein
MVSFYFPNQSHSQYQAFTKAKPYVYVPEQVKTPHPQQQKPLKKQPSLTGVIGQTWEQTTRIHDRLREKTWSVLDNTLLGKISERLRQVADKPFRLPQVLMHSGYGAAGDLQDKYNNIVNDPNIGSVFGSDNPRGNHGSSPPPPPQPPRRPSRRRTERAFYTNFG